MLCIYHINPSPPPLIHLSPCLQYQILFKLAMSQEEAQEISIEDLELSLEVYELESEEKLKKLEALFAEKKTVDLNKMFYEQRSSLEIKFQNIVSDLTEFLINQEIASTDKLRKTFFKLLENPLIFLFKVSRFEIFNLRLNAFDIELQPIDAIAELGASILANIQVHQKINQTWTNKNEGNQYQTYEQFLNEAQIKLIQDQIFLFYSYLRKGGNIIRKKFEDKLRVAELYAKIEEKLLKRCIQTVDAKTLKELSILNYELYLLENTFDVLCFYLKVPFRAQFVESFKELETLAAKAKQSSNYDLFILIFLRYSKEILGKLEVEGIDPVYSSYIENTLTTLLELWGCRLCYFQQFYDVFEKLLLLHPKKHVAIEICLKHSPKLQKDDIVLLRTHFKHDLLQKHSQLLSLLKKKTIQEINASLSDLYHRTLYNLNFKDFGREDILNMLTTLNGNSSLAQFFGIVERALKEWNHTIDLSFAHKYIEGEFKFPKIDKAKIIESITLFNNLCILQEKQFKDFQPIVKAGSIQVALLDLCAFLFANQEGLELIQQSDLLKTFLTNSLQFLNRTSGANTNWSSICQIFTKNLTILTQRYASIIIELVKKLTCENYARFGVKSIVNTYQNIIIAQENLKINSSDTLQTLSSIFLKGVSQKNEEVKLYRFFDSNINDNVLLTATQEAFLRKNALINGEIIEPKDVGCFVLSELEVITNPVQFDKVMDNYYFTLDNNAKKYVQYLVSDWMTLVNNKQEKLASISLSFMQNLITLYPISLPLFCTTRIYLPNNATKRFVEVLVGNVNAESYSILKSTIECRCIRFKNGRDYIKEQIIPLILKESIKIINEGSANIHHYELLALSIKNSKCTDIKTDLIQKAIESVNYQISEEKSSQILFRLSNSHYDLLSKYFEKKEVEMRKKGLQNTFAQLNASETRTKVSPVQTEDSKASLKKALISEQIMITPFAISQEFNSEDSNLEKITASDVKAQDRYVPLSSLRSNLAAKPILPNLINQKANQTYKIVDLSNIKYNIQCHLGSELKHYCLKEGYKLLTTRKEEPDLLESNEQNTTLVQYYLKQFRNPQLSSDVILGFIQSLISGKIQYSSLFVNYSNLQKLFFGLILVFKFASSNAPALKQSPSIVDQILSIQNENRLTVIKKLLEIFSAIGYNNLWAESYNSLSSINYYKQLRQKSGYKQQSPEQSFFSWILKYCLQNNDLKDDLNDFLGKIFTTRPKDQNSLMYKVSIDRALLNSIMKSLQIKNLSYVSHFFHSNFNNLRLYTDQLHEGLKAIGMASKNRAYNEYVQLSKDIEDEQFFLPMKLFKENFSFFIRIEKQGYKFKRHEEQKLGRERVLKVLRSGATGEALSKEIQKVIEEFEVELEKLEYNIASRVKSFYLVTKLRDLSYQNSLTVCLLHQILTEKKENSAEILKKIKQVELFSLISQLYNKLVKFGKKVDSTHFLLTDRSVAQKEVSICSTRRYSHSISKVYEKCQLELDEVFQRCIDVLRVFFASNEGKQWLGKLDVYPPFLAKSFISYQSGEALINAIKTENSQYLQGNAEIILTSEEFSFSSLLKSLRQLRKAELLQKDNIKIAYKDKKYTISEFLTPFKAHLMQSETLSKSKDGYLLFNKYKTSEKTLQEIQILGLIVGYSVYHGIEIDLPLHSSILNATSFGACDLDDLLDIDFKVWEDLRNVISTSQSKDLNLNFSYIFESLETLKPERVELIDKGTSKKVNNLNREEYTDYVCCYLLYKIVSKQINRFLESILYVCPKEILSSLTITQFLSFFLKKYPNYLNEIIKRTMKRRGLILPVSVVANGKRYENSMDYQSIQWFNEVMETLQALKQKLWPNEWNLFLCTWMGQGIDVDLTSRIVVVGRVGSKQQLKQALLKHI